MKPFKQDTFSKKIQKVNELIESFNQRIIVINEIPPPHTAAQPNAREEICKALKFSSYMNQFIRK